MALITDPGDSAADSYVTLQFYKDRLAALGRAHTATDELMEGKLRFGTMWLDTQYGAQFVGQRTFGRLQMREWPRINAYDASNNLIGDMEIPIEVMYATVEVAWKEQSIPGTLYPAPQPRQIKRERKWAGPAGKEIEYTDAPERAYVLPEVEGLLQNLLRLSSGGGTVWMTRV